MHCPSCGTPNRDSRRFCGGCGSSLGWVCPGCAFFNLGDERFCGGCGAPGQPGLVTAPAGEGEHRAASPSLPAARPSASSPPPPPPPAPGAAAPRSQLLAREVAAALEEQRRAAGESKQSVSQDEIDQLFRR